MSLFDNNDLIFPYLTEIVIQLRNSAFIMQSIRNKTFISFRSDSINIQDRTGQESLIYSGITDQNISYFYDFRFRKSTL